MSEPALEQPAFEQPAFEPTRPGRYVVAAAVTMAVVLLGGALAIPVV